jgi:hypothetical protein
VGFQNFTTYLGWNEAEQLSQLRCPDREVDCGL